MLDTLKTKKVGFLLLALLLVTILAVRPVFNLVDQYYKFDDPADLIAQYPEYVGQYEWWSVICAVTHLETDKEPEIRFAPYQKIWPDNKCWDQDWNIEAFQKRDRWLKEHSPMLVTRLQQSWQWRAWSDDYFGRADYSKREAFLRLVSQANSVAYMREHCVLVTDWYPPTELVPGGMQHVFRGLQCGSEFYEY